MQQVRQRLDRRQVDRVRRDVRDRVADLAPALLLARGVDDDALQLDGRFRQLEVRRRRAARRHGHGLRAAAETEQCDAHFVLTRWHPRDHVPPVLVRDRAQRRARDRDLRAAQRLRGRPVDDPPGDAPALLAGGTGRAQCDHRRDQNRMPHVFHSAFLLRSLAPWPTPMRQGCFFCCKGAPKAHGFVHRSVSRWTGAWACRR